ncbi:TonB-dependent receptor [Draconibacterium orientale]|uniref:SusC/RagA family TonB-linked outer membrane protein n=1 Tax=Draconibacterium orientale TaxID=1168034 RepID=UPI002A0A9022|nr:TonB-dependent receptor [Draconibacterium orientale]
MRIIRKNLKVVLFLVAMLSFTLGYAQVKTVTGTVSDAGNGEPLPGVTIVVKGTTQGTITDFDGNFSIDVEEGQTIVLSYIGYTPQEVVISTSNLVNVKLEQSMENLDEVVVIGYGQVKKEDATGSVTAVRAEDFNKGNITSPQDLLVGKASGVVITSSGGAPGAGSTIRIRGGSSLNASNDPLIIIDGIPIANDDVSGGNNFMSFVNPNDIESMTVLKDASATAIYGSRASNGVMIITTKKGQAGRPMQINVDVKTSVSTPIKYVDVYSGDEIRQIAQSKPELYSPETYDLLWNANTNWQEEIFRTSISQDNNVSISGSVKNIPYRASVGYTNQNGILKNTYMRRLTGSLSVNPTLLEGALKVNLNVKGMTTDNNFGDSGAIGSAVSMDPTKPVYDASKTGSAGYFQWENYGANLGTPNPVEQLMEVDNKSDVNRIVANAQFDYKIPFIEGLNANLNIATDQSKGEGYNNRPVTSPSTLTGETVGMVSTYWSENSNDLLDFYLNYKTDFEKINSVLDATAGYSWQHFQREGGNYREGISQPESSYISENYLVSFFGRVNYTLADKYLLTVTLRNDGSSRFQGDNQWGLFPSAAFAWKIKNENFLQNADFLSNLKLRLGWGVTGQQDIGNDYPAQATYVSSSGGSWYPINGEYQPTLRPNAYDPDIKWEETTTQNIGLDFGFMKDRITGAIDVYKRVTDDLLNTVTIPTGSNFSNTLLTNVGSLENKGVELSIDWRAISREDMFLNIGFNISYNDNKITKLLLNDDPDYIGILYGGAMTGVNQVTRVGYPAYSFFVNQQVYYPNGKPIEGMYVDLSGEGGTVNGDNNDKYIYHNPVADVLMGLSASFNYKNFDASFSSRISLGNYVYDGVTAGSSYDQMYQIGYWKNMPRTLNETQFVKRQFTSDYLVSNASFFKLDNVSVGYTFNELKGRLIPRLSFTVQNAVTITKYDGLDPEVSGGIDNNFYPRPRTFMLGIGFTY